VTLSPSAGIWTEMAMCVGSLERSIAGGRSSVPILSCPLAQFAQTQGLAALALSIEVRERRSRAQMGLFDRFRVGRKARGADGRDPAAADLYYLNEWVAEHTGVEAFVEPKTTVTDVTVVLVAADGEWTRRRAGGDAGARRLSERLQIPVYDVQKVGYPQRMRDYDARRRIERERALREELEER
jgi:hypothetical protein